MPAMIKKKFYSVDLNGNKHVSLNLFGLLVTLLLAFNIYLCFPIQVFLAINSPDADEGLQHGAKRDLRSFANGATDFGMTRKKEAMPTNTSLSFNFSACLLIKDDNKILPEWMAYHYTVLPLRHLIVAVDPFSLTSPEPILDKFRELGMDIELWRDEDFLELGKRYWQRPARHNASAYRKIQTHRWRQAVFYRECLNRFQSYNYTWTMLIDSDEYLTFNNFDENEGKPIFWSESLNATARQELIRKFQKQIQTHAHHRLYLPKVGEMTISEYISQTAKGTSTTNTNGNSHWNHHPCILVPRVQFGATESSYNEISSQIPYEEFDPMKFHTFRYLKHGPRHPYPAWPGKSLVHAGWYNNIEITNPHKVLKNNCSSKSPFPDYADMDLRIHHYTGSLELFLSRPGDSRRSKEDFEKRNSNVFGSDSSLQGWLRVFVDHVGKKKALELTEHMRDWAFGEDARATEKMKKLGRENYPYPFGRIR